MYLCDIFSRDMDSLSSTAYVILGMLRREPLSGYEIKALVDNSTRFFWAASYGQIYPELKRLSEAGLVEGADSPTGGRKRTVYEITADGEEELKAWLRQPPEVFEMRDEGLLKLFFADALPPQEAVEIVRSMRGYREEMNRRLREIELTKGEEKGSYRLLVLHCGIEYTDWFVGWCHRVEEEILAAPDEKSERRRS
jgi:PadR family transcriptional regulator, regulatory protein AphA